MGLWERVLGFDNKINFEDSLTDATDNFDVKFQDDPLLDYYEGTPWNEVRRRASAECKGEQPCEDDCKCRYNENGLVDLDWMWRNFPATQYVIVALTNIILGARLTTGNEEDDEKLDKFLNEENIQGISNRLVIREAVKYTLLYGRGGIRWLGQKENEGIMYVKYDKFTVATSENNKYYGFRVPVYILMRKDGQLVTLPTLPNNMVQYATMEDGTADASSLIYNVDALIYRKQAVDETDNYLCISTDNFVNLRTDVSLFLGDAMLNHDQQRIVAIAKSYDQLNKDIESGALDKYLIQPKNTEGYGGAVMNSSGQLKATGGNQLEKIREAFKKNLKRFSKEIADPSATIITIPNGLESEPFKLSKRVTSTDMLEYLQNVGENMMAQAFGVTPSTLELGKMSGNVSMAAVLSTGEKNSIYPLRRLFAEQINGLLKDKLDLKHDVYFEEVTPTEQIAQEATDRTKNAQSAQLAGNLISNVAKGVKEGNIDDTPEVRELIQKAAEFGIAVYDDELDKYDDETQTRRTT